MKKFFNLSQLIWLGLTFGFVLYISSCGKGGSTSASAISTKVTSVAVGNGFTCVRNTAGAVKCLGWNSKGELGNGSNTESNVPVDVSGLTSGVAAVSAGSGHACALTTAGAVKCWGWNEYGQLGNGSKTDSNVPVDVSGLTSGVAAVSANGAHTCALTTAGGVKCWGLNIGGQLGNGSKTDSNVPVDVIGLTSGVAAVSAGDLNTCALTTAGGVKCWGLNSSGELGNGSYTDSNVPVDVSGLTSGVAAVSTSTSGTVCALTTAGGVKCWGFNYYGGLGNGSNTDSNVPVDVSGLTSGVAAVSANGANACALTTAGGVKCWGRNEKGELGNGSNTDYSNVPVDVSGLTSGVAAVSVAYDEPGFGHTCALTTSGGVKCWGYNFYGQLANGTRVDSNIPVDANF